MDGGFYVLFTEMFIQVTWGFPEAAPHQRDVDPSSVRGRGAARPLPHARSGPGKSIAAICNSRYLQIWSAFKLLQHSVSDGSQLLPSPLLSCGACEQRPSQQIAKDNGRISQDFSFL